MFNALASFWHEIVFWWAVAMTIIVCYDHSNKVRAIFEWALTKIRGKR